MTTWNQLSCSTLPRIASDHHHLLLCFDMGITPRSSFKFHKMWLSHLDCHRLVSEVWRWEVVGCPMFVLSHKLRILKKEFKVWNVQVFGNIQERVKQDMTNVAAIQDVINSIGSDGDLLNQEHLAQSDLLQALVVEEEFWNGKARINWQTEGDRNISFFHKITKIRQASKALYSLRDGDIILVNQDQIAQHTLAYFTNLYASPNDARLNHLIQSIIPALVSEEDNLMSNLLALKSLIHDYAHASDQHVNLAKCKFYTKCLWLVGDGNKVNFWKDNWTGHALVDILRIPVSVQASLVAKVSDFVLNIVWTIPKVIAETFPNVVDSIVQLSISRNQDKLIWQ
ncbi:hypothetical protein Lal_00036556 [Lupinus albus]|nr:hypothetical protein Lal_00036556 [Lupinus albus]